MPKFMRKVRQGREDWRISIVKGWHLSLIYLCLTYAQNVGKIHPSHVVELCAAIDRFFRDRDVGGVVCVLPKTPSPISCARGLGQEQFREATKPLPHVARRNPIGLGQYGFLFGP